MVSDVLKHKYAFVFFPQFLSTASLLFILFSKLMEPTFLSSVLTLFSFFSFIESEMEELKIDVVPTRTFI